MTTEPNTQSILIVEDEPQMRRFLQASLAAQGYRVSEAKNAAEAIALATTQPPALILLDLGLPDVDGIDMTRRFREWSQVPIIVISARGREDDKIQALDAGADDYLTKPFGVGELLARMRVALRHGRAQAGAPNPILSFGSLVIDVAAHVVARGGAELHLTPTEYKMLVLLATHAGKVVTHRQILREVWGPAYEDQTHYVRVHMAELRKKVEPDPAKPRWLTTEPGVGYRFRYADESAA